MLNLSIFKLMSILTMQTENVKQAAHKIIDTLSDNATWNDVMYEIYIRQSVEEGIEAANRGEFASDDEVRKRFMKWDVKLEG